MNVIELKDITMSYGPNRILEHFNLSVEQGTFLTMIGSSGCGKTTALKLMTGAGNRDHQRHGYIPDGYQ